MYNSHKLIMRFFLSALMSLILSSHSFANDIDIKTLSKNGSTVFMLQVGAFTKKENAEKFKEQISSQAKEPVSVEFQEDKKLYLVQIGPIKDYPSTRNLKEQLAQWMALKTETPQTTANPEQNDEEQLSTEDKPRSKEIKGTVWNLRSADIRAVITEISRVTGKNFIVDPRVQGKISIISSNPISNKELYQVFLSMLQVSGYAAIDSGSVTKIIPNIDAKTQSADLLNQLRHPPQGEEMVVEVVPVKYVPSEQLVPVLRPLMPQWSNVSAYMPSNMLILSGRANNIRRLAEIIKQVDSSSANGIDMVPLKHALAMDVVNTLKDLVKPQGASSMRSQTMLAADDRSNSILLSGNKTERIRLRLLINKLDREGREGTNSNTQVIYLNYLRAEDLVPILAGIAQANFSGNVGTTIGTVTKPVLDSTNPASSMAGFNSSGNGSSSSLSGSQPTSNSSATPNTSSASNQTEGTTKPTVQIIAEPNTNSVIINAPSTLIRILKSVISQLDIRPAQLLIEALVAEVDEADANNLGIEWGTNGQTGDPAKFRQGFAIINSNSNTRDLQAQIYALARQQKANILSTPSVVVLDNRQAKILVGKQVSVASTTYPNNAGGTTTASPYTTFDRVNVALHLYVRPQITRGEGIQLQIDQGNDTLDPSTTDSTTQPVFKISSIVTDVHVESGDIVVLGGLAQDSLANNDSRLPILGDIPGIGKLFQHNIRTRAKRVLMVFIKPHIIRNQNESVQLTNGKYNPIRDYQLGFVRDQEEYDPRNQDSVLPPLTEATLPKPFSHPPKQAMMTK